MTTPDKFRSEIYIVIKLFENGLKTLHLKKPKFSKNRYKNYINQIPKKYHNRIIIHSYFSLMYKFNLKGINISSNTKPSKLFFLFYDFFKKRKIKIFTIHSLNQLKELNKKKYDYILAGPLFKSNNDESIINDKFNENQIKEIIFSYPKQIVFYGGINAENINSLNNNHLFGLLFLGVIWYNPNKQPIDVFLDFKRRIKTAYENN